MDTNDPAVEKTELVINALHYAQVHNLDINNIDDVKKILEALNVENENVEEFMKLLQNAETLMDMQAAKKEEENKSDLPN